MRVRSLLEEWRGELRVKRRMLRDTMSLVLLALFAILLAALLPRGPMLRWGVRAGAQWREE